MEAAEDSSWMILMAVQACGGEEGLCLHRAIQVATASLTGQRKGLEARLTLRKCDFAGSSQRGVP